MACQQFPTRAAQRKVRICNQKAICRDARNHIQISAWPSEAWKTMTNSTTSPPASAWRADAARYNIMCRLVPSVNHKLAGSMQPITMLAGMLARHLQRTPPDMLVLTKQVANMQLACKAAITTRTDVLAWFQPSEQQLTSIASEATQCASLLTAEFAMRGCSIDNQTANGPAVVRQASVRTMLTAVLFGILDNTVGPVTVHLQDLPASNQDASIVASWTPLAPSNIPPSHNSQVIGWADVQAIADQLRVGIRRKPTRIEMHFAVAT